jgi:hypothetical protein
MPAAIFHFQCDYGSSSRRALSKEGRAFFLKCRLEANNLLPA